MTATFNRLDPTRVELEVAVPEEELEKARERAYRALVKNTRIPGFRPGKAPRRIYEQQYGSMGIEERAIDEVLPRVYLQAIEQHQLHPLERPEIEWLPRENGEPMRFKAKVAVRPDIELGDYTAIRLEVEVPAVDDQEVEDSVNRLRREAAVLIPVERPAQLGDMIVANYRGTVEGEAFKGGTADNQELELLEDRFIPGFASGIVGMSAGEHRTVEATFPDAYFEPSLAGKTALFAIELLEVKEPELPEADDEFAARFLPQSPTMTAMRTELRGRLEQTHRTRIKNEQADALIERLLDMHDFPLPPTLVDREVDSLLQNEKVELARALKTWESHLEEIGKTEDEYKNELKPRSEKRVKTLLLIEAIARKEGVTASPAEIDAELSDLSREYGQPKERIRQAIGEHLHGLVDGIIRGKTLDALLEKALGFSE